MVKVRQTAKPYKRQPIVINPDGANSGGSCQGCGLPLHFWFIYRLCNRCLIPDTNLVTQRLT